MHTEERGVQTYFPKVVKSFRTVATQTDNNIAINILNSKKVHPEDMNILEMDHMEDHNYSIGPSSKYMQISHSQCQNHFQDQMTTYSPCNESFNGCVSDDCSIYAPSNSSEEDLESDDESC